MADYDQILLWIYRAIDDVNIELGILADNSRRIRYSVIRPE